jgi:hypothetical protein
MSIYQLCGSIGGAEFEIDKGLHLRGGESAF